MSLVAFLAWVGLGADGLSSSSYGPEEAFKALGTHVALAPFLALATALTVLIISTAYSRIIEHFPFGGGGYVVATRLLGPAAGVVSGSALMVDYVLTITTSVAAGADAVFSFVPPAFYGWKLPVGFAIIAVLVVLNLRGVRESVTALAPIFLVFLVTHVILIGGAVLTRGDEVRVVSEQVRGGLSSGMATLGLGGMLALFLRAYSMGAGTYTGIEAVSNGLQIMREPKVETAKRTMVLMAVSLSFTAGGITLAYLLLHVTPVAGQTMNAVLADRFAGGFHLGGLPLGRWFVWITLASEALLLFVAAQAGFLDGPRVMANMAVDSWAPHRFAQLSDRLTMQNGVLLMGGSSVLALVYTRGDITTLVTLYAINVFVTFSLSQLAMCRFWWQQRRDRADWGRQVWIHVVGLVLCLGILVVNVYEKFREGAWVTLVVTGAVVAVFVWTRAHYRKVQQSLRRLDDILPSMPKAQGPVRPLDPKKPTAVLLVGGYAGLGVHSLLTIQRLFPNYFQNFVFLSVGVIDSATFKDIAEVVEVKDRTRAALDEYVALAQGLGLAATARMSLGTEAVQTATELCRDVAREFPRALFFAGKLVFEQEHWYQRVLHNETAYQIQRRLQFAGLNAMVLPVRLLEGEAPPRAA
ncbi:MAG TPA: APC family permease [Myxococcaceae bacterium]|nr:APC family permease [Myxococcaceae bacterium]